MKEKEGLYFSFEFVGKPKISKGINKLDGKKACREHIPVKLIKSNKDLFPILYTIISTTPCSVLIFTQT